MLLRSLELENFRQYNGQHRLELPVDLASDKNIVLIGGLNGAGKTSILEALRLALFGKANEDLWAHTTYKAFMRQCLNKQAILAGVYEFRLTVELEVGDVSSYGTLQIERRWRFSERLEIIKETLVLHSNQKEKLGLTQEEAELYIQERLPYGVSRFVFFDGEKIQELARDDAFQTETAEAIRSILGLRIHQELENDLWIYERNLLRENAADEGFKVAEQALSRALTQLESLRRQRIDRNGELLEMQRELEQLQAERKRLGSRQLRNRIEIDGTLASFKQQREEVQKRLVHFMSHELPLLVLRPLLGKLHDRLLLELDLEQREIVKSLLQRKKSQLLDAFRLTGGSQDASLETAWDLVVGASAYTPALRHRNLSIEQKYALVHRLAEAQGQVTNQAQELFKALDTLEHKIRKVLNDKRALPTDAAYINLEDRERDLQSRIKSLSAEVGALAVQEKIAGNEYASAQRTYEQACHKVALSQEAAKKVERAKMIRGAITTFLNRLAARKALEVQGYLTRMFLDLARKESLVSEFVLDPEAFALTVTDKHGNRLELQTLSAGEKEIFAISFLWALSKAAVQELPMVIDTPLGRLDSVHRAHIAERFLPNANRQVIVLSTDTEIDADLYAHIKEYIAASFLVEYDPRDQTSRIKPGYFPVEVVSALVD